ncbi:hypothetical protein METBISCDRAFT_29000, partial [Metschnikowia bicuspidata]
MSQPLKRRGKKASSKASPVAVGHGRSSPVPHEVPLATPPKEPQSYYCAGLVAVTAVAAFLRFRILGYPAKVVFDE